MGDGSHWIWNIADQHFPGAIQIVDLYHAREHLWDLARLLFPGDLAAQKRWIMRKLYWLENGKIKALVKALRKLANSNSNLELVKAIRIEAEYFESNRDRMQYPEFRKKNLFVGSGVIGSHGLQNRDRSSRTQAIRNVLDCSWRKRHYLPPLLLPQRQV